MEDDFYDDSDYNYYNHDDDDEDDYERLLISERISIQDEYYERTGGLEYDPDDFPKYDEDNGCWLDRDDWESNCM